MLSGHLKPHHGIPQIGPLGAIDTSRDSTAFWVVRHQDQVAAGEADKGRQRGTFGSTFIFFDLNQQLLPLLNDILDTNLRHWSRGGEIAKVRPRDFLQRQKTLALGSIVNKGGLKARFDAGYPALVNITFAL